jgi:hypothetical protein
MERRMDRRERERERSRQSSSNDRVDLDSRTPLAWQHRDFNYQHSANSQSNFHERYPGIVFSFPNNNITERKISAMTHTKFKQKIGLPPSCLNCFSL